VADLIVSQSLEFGEAALIVLTAIIAVAVGLLVFRWGWRKINNVAGEPSYMSSYDGINFGAVSSVARRKIRESYYRNTEGI